MHSSSGCQTPGEFAQKWVDNQHYTAELKATIGIQTEADQQASRLQRASLLPCVYSMTMKNSQTEAAVGLLPNMPAMGWNSHPSPDCIEIIALPPDFGYDACRSLVCSLLNHHDALRMAIRKRDGQTQFVVPAYRDEDIILHQFVDSITLPEEDAGPALLERVKENFSRSGDKLASFTFYLSVSTSSSYLVFVLDHFLYDAYAVQILKEDIITLLENAGTGNAAHLPSKTVSYRAWGLRMHEFLQSSQAQNDLAYWRARPWDRVKQVPVDFPDRYSWKESMRIATVHVGECASGRLLANARRRLRASVFEIIYTSIIMAIRETFGFSEGVLVLTTLLSERVGLFDDLDTSRTVGNFAGISDIPIEMPRTMDPIQTLQSVISQLNAIPSGGKTCGILGMLNDPELSHRNSRVMINHIGYVDAIRSTIDVPNDADNVHVPAYTMRPVDGRDTLDTPAYQFDLLVPSANYKVRLHFVEQTANYAGDRCFDILINDKMVERGFDIVKAAGAKWRVVIKEYECPADDHGQIVVRFVSYQSLVHKALVNAIEILPAAPATDGSLQGDAVYRINAGGPAVDPFDEDRCYIGGGSYATQNQFDLSTAHAPAPHAVYQSERNGVVDYSDLSWGDLNIKSMFANRLYFEIQYHSDRCKRDTIALFGRNLLKAVHRFASPHEYTVIR